MKAILIILAFALIVTLAYIAIACNKISGLIDQIYVEFEQNEIEQDRDTEQ